MGWTVKPLALCKQTYYMVSPLIIDSIHNINQIKSIVTKHFSKSTSVVSSVEQHVCQIYWQGCHFPLMMMIVMMM